MVEGMLTRGKWILFHWGMVQCEKKAKQTGLCDSWKRSGGGSAGDRNRKLASCEKKSGMDEGREENGKIRTGWEVSEEMAMRKICSRHWVKFEGEEDKNIKENIKGSAIRKKYGEGIEFFPGLR